MNDSHEDASGRSRLYGQPAPRRLGPALPDVGRPSYDELRQQRCAADVNAIVPYLSERARAAVGLPPAPAPGCLDGANVMVLREYLLQHPAEVAALPASARDLLSL